jgi:hypothetical protein
MVRKQKKASFLVCDTKLTQRPQSNHIPVVFMGNTTISFPSDMVLEVHTKDDQQQDETSAERKSEAVTNEYVLNVAFLSFLGFTTLQCFFAVMARSQSMMADWYVATNRFCIGAVISSRYTLTFNCLLTLRAAAT